MALTEFFVATPPLVYALTAIPRAVLQVVFFSLLAFFAGGQELARFALIGNAIQVAANIGLAEVTETVAFEKWQGTLALLAQSPGRRVLSLLGKSLAGSVVALAAVGIAFVGGTQILGINLRLDAFLIAMPIIVIVTGSVTGLGLSLGAASLPWRSEDTLYNSVAYGLMVLCGINFPLSVLPDAVEVVSRLLPITNGLLAVREVFDGASLAGVIHLIAAELMVAIAYLGTGLWLFSHRLEAARRDATIDLL